TDVQSIAISDKYSRVEIHIVLLKICKRQVWLSVTRRLHPLGIGCISQMLVGINISPPRNDSHCEFTAWHRMKLQFPSSAHASRGSPSTRKAPRERAGCGHPT